MAEEREGRLQKAHLRHSCISPLNDATCHLKTCSKSLPISVSKRGLYSLQWKPEHPVISPAEVLMKYEVIGAQDLPKPSPTETYLGPTTQINEGQLYRTA